MRITTTSALKTLFFVLGLGLPSNLVGADATSQINAIFSTYMDYAGGIDAFAAAAAAPDGGPILTAKPDTLTALWNAIGNAAKATAPTDATQLNNLQQAFWNGIIMPATILPDFNATDAANCALYTAFYNASQDLGKPSCTLLTHASTPSDDSSMQEQLSSFVASLNLPTSITKSTPIISKRPASAPPKKLKTSKKTASTPAPASPAPAPISAPTKSGRSAAIKAIVAKPGQVRRMQQAN